MSLNLRTEWNDSRVNYMILKIDAYIQKSLDTSTTLIMITQKKILWYKDSEEVLNKIKGNDKEFPTFWDTDHRVMQVLILLAIFHRNLSFLKASRTRLGPISPGENNLIFFFFLILTWLIWLAKRFNCTDFVFWK